MLLNEHKYLLKTSSSAEEDLEINSKGIWLQIPNRYSFDPIYPNEQPSKSCDYQVSILGFQYTRVFFARGCRECSVSKCITLADWSPTPTRLRWTIFLPLSFLSLLPDHHRTALIGSTLELLVTFEKKKIISHFEVFFMFGGKGIILRKKFVSRNELLS